MNKRNLFSWLFYDFGNSFFATALSGMFLAQWLIIDNKLDDIWYGGSTALATLAVLFTAPVLGERSDIAGRRMPYLIKISALVIVFNLLLSAIALFLPNGFSTALIVLAVASVVQYLYQLSLVFHNALLREVASPKSIGKISGIGEGCNSFGWMIATIALLPFANGSITLLGESGRQQVFLPATLIFVVFALPMLLFFRETGSPSSAISQPSRRFFFAEIRELFINDWNAAIFLVAFSLISDINLTLNLYFAVVMDALYHIDDNTKSLIFAISMLSTIVVGYLFGRLGDRVGYKPLIQLSCVCLISGSLVFFFSSSLSALYVVALVAGAGTGGYYVLTRAMLLKIAPPDRIAEYFGFYSAFQRFASILAPLIWGGITLALKDQGAVKFQAAGVAMIILLALGMAVLGRVREEKRS